MHVQIRIICSPLGCDSVEAAVSELSPLSDPNLGCNLKGPLSDVYP